jgi:hypothetical protein
MQEKNVFWFTAPAFERVYDNLFANGRGKAIVAGADDAGSLTHELNILGRVGLRQAGLIDHIQADAITDLSSFACMWEWGFAKHGHPFLRMLAAYTVLGADYFYIRVCIHYGQEFNEWAQEFADNFMPMLGKGLIFTPKPEEMVGLNPIGFAMHEPSEIWIEDSFEGHDTNGWDPPPEMEQAVINRSGVWYGNAPTAPHSLQAVLLNKKRQYGGQVPATPYGPFVIVPAHADLDKVVGVREWWHTDGTFIWREGGPKMQGEEAAKALRESFEQSARELPFRAFGDDIFIQTLLVEENRYRIFLIEPGWIEPADRNIDLQCQLKGDVSSLKDLLSGDNLKFDGSGRTALTIPAGSLRILEAVVDR